MDDGSGKALKEANLEVLGKEAEAQSSAAVQREIFGQTPAAAQREVSRQTPAVHSQLSGEGPKPATHETSRQRGPAFEPPGRARVEEAAPIGPGSRVRVFGIKAQPHLNGQCGRVVEWSDAEGRWKVHMDDGSGKALKASNLELIAASVKTSLEGPATDLPVADQAPRDGGDAAPGDSYRRIRPGARICVAGLKAQPHLNGQFGSAVEWDSAEGRWRVRMDDGSGKALKDANLEVVPPTMLPGYQPQRADGHDVSSPRESPAEPMPPANAMAQASSSSGISPGTRVEIGGLQARPELNGQRGEVVSWEAEESRWKVRMDDGTGKMFKTQNMTALEPQLARAVEEGSGAALTPGCRVRVVGVKAQPHLNGSCGSVVEWDLAELRWRVWMDDDSGKAFKPANLQVIAYADAAPAVPAAPAGRGDISVGMRVVICGLQGRPELNGHKGEVAQWDAEEGKWKVRMDDGTGKILKAQNLKPCEQLQPAAEQAAKLEPGCRVRVSGIVNQPHLNGQCGRVAERDFNSAEEVWRVSMDDGSKKAMKATKLEIIGEYDEPIADCTNGWCLEREAAKPIEMESPRIVSGSRVRIVGVQNHPHLNGQCGSVVAWDEIEERWQIRMDDGSGKAMKPANLLPLAAPEGNQQQLPTDSLIPGAYIQVCGLKARPELNGQQGQLVDWDEADERWRVRMDDGSGKMFKQENLTSLEAPAAASLQKSAAGEDGAVRRQRAWPSATPI